MSIVPPRPCLRIPQRGVAMAKKEIPVILTQTIDRVGFKGEILQVKKGFARNYLFPRGLADHPFPENVRLYGADVAEQRALLERSKLQAQLQKRLKKIVVLMKRHKMPDGSLHAPVRPENIIEKLGKQHKINIEREQLLLDADLLNYGKHTVRVLLNGVECDLVVKVDTR